MSRFFPDDVSPVINHAIARVERHLPQPGEILVRVGSRVEPDDILARAALPSKPRVLNIAQALGILPRDIAAAMRKQQGARVAEGELIARIGMVGRRSCLAPVSGTLTRIDPATGYVTIEPEAEPLELRAQVRGLVMEVVADQTIIIETPAASIYGIAGMGSDRFGVLRLLVSDPSEVIDAGHIDARSSYAVVIAGAGITAAALERAVQEQVRGIVVGGIEVDELVKFLGPRGEQLWQIGRESWNFPVAESSYDPGLTLVVTEGFGTRPMSQPIFDLLASNDQQEALMQGATRLYGPLIRPRVALPLARSQATAALEPPQPALAVGSTVRLLDDEHLGQISRVVMLAEDPEILPSGVRGLSAQVELPDGERIIVARSGLEALA